MSDFYEITVTAPAVSSPGGFSRPVHPAAQGFLVPPSISAQIAANAVQHHLDEQDQQLAGAPPLVAPAKAPVTEIVTKAQQLKTFDPKVPAANSWWRLGFRASRLIALYYGASFNTASLLFHASKTQEDEEITTVYHDGELIKLEIYDDILQSGTYQIGEPEGDTADLNPWKFDITGVPNARDGSLEATIKQVNDRTVVTEIVTTVPKTKVEFNYVSENDIANADRWARQGWQDQAFYERTSELEQTIAEAKAALAADRGLKRSDFYYGHYSSVYSAPALNPYTWPLKRLRDVQVEFKDRKAPPQRVPVRFPRHEADVPPFSISVTGLAKGVRIQTRLARGSNAGAMQQRKSYSKDKKTKSQKMYLSALLFINRTWGKVSEAIDMINVFQASLKFKKDTRVCVNGVCIMVRAEQSFADLPIRYREAIFADTEGLLEYTYIDYQDLIVGLAVEQASDFVIGKTNQLEGKWIKNHPRLANMLGNPSTWARRVRSNVESTF